MKRRLFVGSIVSSVFLYLAVRGIEWRSLWSVLGRTNYVYLMPTVGFTMLGHYSRAFRWKFMMLPVKRIPTHSLFAATAVGFMANNLLPARLGEFVRAYVLGHRESVSRSACFATIVYERIVDVFSLLVLLLIMLRRVPGPEWLATSAVWILVLNVALLVVVFLMERNRAALRRIVSWTVHPLPHAFGRKIVDSTGSFAEGLATVSRPHTLVPIAFASVLVWLFAALGLYYCLLALDMHTPFIAAITLVVIVSMGTMIPSAPAYLGTTQYACVVSLSLFGVGKTEALAYSLLYHATQFFPVTLVGLFYLWKMRIRFGDISQKR